VWANLYVKHHCHTLLESGRWVPPLYPSVSLFSYSPCYKCLQYCLDVGKYIWLSWQKVSHVSSFVLNQTEFSFVLNQTELLYDFCMHFIYCWVQEFRKNNLGSKNSSSASLFCSESDWSHVWFLPMNTIIAI